MIDRQKLLALLDGKIGPGGARVAGLADLQELADAITPLADSCSRNIPRGVYRNSLGVELKVMGYVGDLTGVNIGIRTLGGDIAYAEWYDDLFKTTTPAIVTEDSLRNCGYVLVEPAEDES